MSFQGFRGSNRGGPRRGQNFSSDQGATPPPQQKKRTAWNPEYDKLGQEAQKHKIFMQVLCPFEQRYELTDYLTQTRRTKRTLICCDQAGERQYRVEEEPDFSGLESGR